MSPDEARARQGRTAFWNPEGVVYQVRIGHVDDDKTPGYDGPPRVWVHFLNMASEFDVDPKELSKDA
jgi:hypothetical protein